MAKGKEPLVIDGKVAVVTGGASGIVPGFCKGF